MTINQNQWIAGVSTTYTGSKTSSGTYSIPVVNSVDDLPKYVAKFMPDSDAVDDAVEEFSPIFENILQDHLDIEDKDAIREVSAELLLYLLKDESFTNFVDKYILDVQLPKKTLTSEEISENIKDLKKKHAFYQDQYEKSKLHYEKSKREYTESYLRGHEAVEMEKRHKGYDY